MVYSGVPSKGCASCRAKRTKCDQALPSCGQCRRTRRVCSGYRNEQTLIFRDETRTVISKAQAAKARSNKLYSEVEPIEDFNQSNDAGGAFLGMTQIPASNQDISRSLYVPIEEQGSCYFFYHFVRENFNSRIGYNRYLPTIYNLASSHSELPAIIQAIGMAGISNSQMSHEAMIIARRKHTTVLRTLNSSLQDPTTATLDSTFMTVMLLSLYETVTGSTPQSLRTWLNHVNGATAIMRLRGKASLQTVIGRHIFALLRHQIVVDCMQRRALMSPEVIEWSENAINMETDVGSRHEQEMFPILTRLCTLRSVTAKEMSNDPLVLTNAKGIDADLIKWAERIPSCFKYTRQLSNDAEKAPAGYYHVYSNLSVVGTWNLHRSARILTHEVMGTWLSCNLTSRCAQLRRSEAILSLMSADICASVPCVFGQVNANGWQIGTSHLARASTGYGILWPLYLAATMNSATPTTRAWVISQLDMMGRTMGIQLAKSLAAVLRTQKEVTAWDSFGSTVDEEVNDW